MQGAIHIENGELMKTLFRVFMLCLVANSIAVAQHPNVILINCDDLGYADIGCFGSTLHRTPRIDSLATDGMKLTSYYVTSGVCSPSRASLMTGCYPRRVDLHIDHKGGWVLFPRGKKGLNPSEVTIAEVLKMADYHTAIVGKWHLGDQPPFLPTKQGFDSYFGIPYSNDMGHTDRKNKSYPPLPVLRNEEVIEQEPDQRYITQRYTDEAKKFIRANAKEQFFLYLPHTMPHWPQYSSERFAGKSKNGKWGDAVEEIDWSTGEILDLLDELKLTENTIVIFMSDNGGAVQHGAKNGPLKGGKGSTFEGGQRVCCVVRWPAKIQPGSVCDELITSMDWLPTLAVTCGSGLPSDRTIDGRNILPLLMSEDGATTPHRAFYYYKRDSLQCVRSGDWKLRVAADRRRQSAMVEPELYNLKDDIGETKNVAAEHPDVIAKLQEFVKQARRDLGDGKQPGANQRKAGWVENPRGLTDPIE